VSGFIISGASTVLINGQPVARNTDMVIGSCGHTGIITSSSPVVLAEGLGVARIGDSVSGCIIGQIVTGSENVLAS
jgi:uncharacterized Zn-binding protein involved in type VI secretion